MFSDFMGSNLDHVNVLHIKLQEIDSNFYARPYLNVSFKSQDKNLALSNLTSKLNSKTIESEFKEFSSGSELDRFLRLELIDGCNETQINGLFKF